MVSNCPKCDTETKGLEYCLNCGFKLATKTGINILKSSEHKICKSCSYPLREEHNSCPQCGTSVNAQLESAPETKTLTLSNKSTPFKQAALKAVSLSSSPSGKDIQLTNKEVIVNRGLVDESDKTISLEKHARITEQNGKWFIENVASNQALFIQVTNKTKLENGMIILVGDSKFYQFQSE